MTITSPKMLWCKGGLGVFQAWISTPQLKFNNNKDLQAYPPFEQRNHRWTADYPLCRWQRRWPSGWDTAVWTRPLKTSAPRAVSCCTIPDTLVKDSPQDWQCTAAMAPCCTPLGLTLKERHSENKQSCQSTPQITFPEQSTVSQLAS